MPSPVTATATTPLTAQPTFREVPSDDEEGCAFQCRSVKETRTNNSNSQPFPTVDTMGSCAVFKGYRELNQPKPDSIKPNAAQKRCFSSDEATDFDGKRPLKLLRHNEDYLMPTVRRPDTKDQLKSVRTKQNIHSPNPYLPRVQENPRNLSINHEINSHPNKITTHETDKTNNKKFCWSSLPIELKFRIIKMSDPITIINLQKACHINDDLYLIERLRGNVLTINGLNESERSSLYKNTEQVFANCASQLKPFQEYLVNASTPDRAALFCKLVEDKMLPNPSSPIKILSAPKDKAIVNAKIISDQQAAIIYNNGEILIQNIDAPTVEKSSQITLKHYDNPTKFYKIQIQMLSDHRVVTTSKDKTLIWDLQSSPPSCKEIDAPYYCCFIDFSERSLVTLNDGTIKHIDPSKECEGELLAETKLSDTGIYCQISLLKQSGNKYVAIIILDNTYLNWTLEFHRLTNNSDPANKDYVDAIEVKNRNRDPNASGENFNEKMNNFSVSGSGYTTTVNSAVYKSNSPQFHEQQILSIIKTGHIAASFDKEICLWNDAPLSAPNHTLKGHTSFILQLVELDNGLLASLSHKEIKIWNLLDQDHPSCIGTIKSEKEHFFRINRLSANLFASISLPILGERQSQPTMCYVWSLLDLQRDTPPDDSVKISPITSLTPPENCIFFVYESMSRNGKLILKNIASSEFTILDLFSSPLLQKAEA